MLPKVLWNSLLATPALIGAALVISSSAYAAETNTTEVDTLLNDLTSAATLTTDMDALAVSASTVEAAAVEVPAVEAPAEIAAAPEAVTPAVADLDAEVAATTVEAPAAQAPAEIAQAVPSVSELDQVIQYSNEGANSQAQVTSISQLSDVQPTDWAFQALQSLVERYGCIAGYPDGTYKGNRAMTRYEFAAGLNACLDRISELIASATADLATQEDLATLQRLQEEFAAELATLRGRVDSLEARTAELEANQFSTTTKLRGETIFAVGVPIDSDDAFDDETIAGYRIRLNFDTSFTGEDLLRARLQARDFSNFTSFGGNVGWSFGGDDDDDIELDDLLYTFPVGDSIQLIIGANSIGDSDFVASTISPFDSSGSGSLTNFGAPAQYNFIPGGVGAGAIVQLTDNLSLDFGYAATDAGNPAPESGLFNGDYGLIAQLTYLSDFLDAALTYSNSYASGGIFANVTPEVANIYGGQVNFKFDGFQIGGGVAYIPVTAIGTGDYDVWSYQATLAFPDLGGDGNLLGILGGVAPYRSSIPSAFLPVGSPVGASNEDNTVVVETFYRFRVSDNISITPGVIWLSNPGNNEETDDSFIGAIRTTFSF